MFQTITKVSQWLSFPILLLVALCSRSAGRYELLLDVVVCMGAVIAVRRAVWQKEYFFAAGFVGIALVFVPLLLVVKIFLLMTIACVATFFTILAAFKPQPLPAL
jgi:hypothetical protein